MTVMMPDYWTPGHNFYDHNGRPIALLEWARLSEGARKVVTESDVTLPGMESATLRTVYLGFLDPSIAEARLFGTALILAERRIKQLDVWNTHDEAIAGHQRHYEATILGYHCNYCRFDIAHEWG